MLPCDWLILRLTGYFFFFFWYLNIAVWLRFPALPARREKHFGGPKRNAHAHKTPPQTTRPARTELTTRCPRVKLFSVLQCFSISFVLLNFIFSPSCLLLSFYSFSCSLAEEKEESNLHGRKWRKAANAPKQQQLKETSARNQKRKTKTSAALDSFSKPRCGDFKR